MTPAERVYKIIKKIPKGKVATYGQIAKLAQGLNPRFIGYLLHYNPDPDAIPCHRIVNAQGKLASGFAFGGVPEQKRRLETEGIPVNEWKVDLQVYQWKG
ncbi:MGMT family protein [Candidatus Gottesmanbacteria bacterium]|nr:MGMT family protein [Candidatus Gottesmanbacteria bacterium]